jgi:hypothetical protein
LEYTIDSEAERAAQEKRRRHIALYRKYWAGDPYEDAGEWRRLTGLSPEVSPPRLKVNLARSIVARPAQFAFERAERIVAADPKAQALIDRVAAGNSLLERLGDVCAEGSLTGDILLTFSFAPESAALFPVSVVGAEDFDFECSPHDESVVEFYRIEYRYEGDGGRIMRHREEIASDETRYYEDWVEETGAPSGILARLGLGVKPRQPRLLRAEPNPLGFIPAVHVKNRARAGMKFGTSDLRGILTLLDDFNWKMSQRSKNISRTTSAILKNINGRITSDFISDETILSVTGDNPQVDYLVNNADMAVVKTHLDDLKQAMSDVTGVVFVSPERLHAIGAMSGFALTLLYEPLVNLANEKRRAFGAHGVERLLSLIVKAARVIGLLPKTGAGDGASIVYRPYFEPTRSERTDEARMWLDALAKGVASVDEVREKMGLAAVGVGGNDTNQ